MSPFVAGIIRQMHTSHPFLHLSPCSTVNPTPQLLQQEGRFDGRIPFLMEMLLHHLVRASFVPENWSGMVESQVQVAPACLRHFFTFSGDHTRRT